LILTTESRVLLVRNAWNVKCAVKIVIKTCRAMSPHSVGRFFVDLRVYKHKYVLFHWNVVSFHVTITFTGAKTWVKE
jgi:hypothetical protein